jgi:hypothetical protein
LVFPKYEKFMFRDPVSIRIKHSAGGKAINRCGKYFTVGRVHNVFQKFDTRKTYGDRERKRDRVLRSERHT